MCNVRMKKIKSQQVVIYVYQKKKKKITWKICLVLNLWNVFYFIAMIYSGIKILNIPYPLAKDALVLPLP